MKILNFQRAARNFPALETFTWNADRRTELMFFDAEARHIHSNNPVRVDHRRERKVHFFGYARRGFDIGDGE